MVEFSPSRHPQRRGERSLLDRLAAQGLLQRRLSGQLETAGKSLGHNRGKSKGESAIMNRLLPAVGLLLALLFHFGLTANPASADGKYYSVADRAPPHLPYQRALIAFDGEREILVVQSKFQGAGDDPLDDIGWVVPVPALPQVGTLSPAGADRLFRELNRNTQIEKIRVSEWLVFLLILILGMAVAHSLIALIRLLFSGTRKGKIGWLTVASLVLLGLVVPVGEPPIHFLFFIGILTIAVVFAAVSLFKFFRSGTWKRRASYGGWNLATMLLGGFLSLPIAIPQFSDYTKKGGVDVLKDEVVGKLEVKVIRALTASDLTDWLKKHRFGFNQADITVFESYMAKGWVFVTARPATGAERADVIGHRGMLAPLVLNFPTKQAIYPLALTATAAKELPTQVDLYVFSQRKMDAGGRMQLSYAAPDKLTELLRLADLVEPKQSLDRATLKEGFLTRFYGRLDEQQMSTDLVLQPATDDVSYTRAVIW
jgi:hypothetical protein